MGVIGQDYFSDSDFSLEIFGISRKIDPSKDSRRLPHDFTACGSLFQSLLLYSLLISQCEPAVSLFLDYDRLRHTAGQTMLIPVNDNCRSLMNLTSENDLGSQSLHILL